eukprot:CAMPEP_0202685230 /NCGR_PEP_ID=MMETSP1385-20130828/973_1 /ASSEMBLY_ACC=CAM_ASM_000861 /TAXON_ID=933848 /ORGANISM="Elphidium margaritaceum" /LENGTH=210 /DNA_ID=CAMNT_0049339541 /DNA_START=113 /DNA_END=745 /DNA_ORIENTATION=+
MAYVLDEITLMENDSMLDGYGLCGREKIVACITSEDGCKNPLTGTFYMLSHPDSSSSSSNSTVFVEEYHFETCDASFTEYCNQKTYGTIWFACTIAAVVFGAIAACATCIPLCALPSMRTLAWPCFWIGVIPAAGAVLAFLILSDEKGVCWSWDENSVGTYSLALSSMLCILAAVSYCIAGACTCCLHKAYQDGADFYDDVIGDHEMAYV